LLFLLYYDAMMMNTKKHMGGRVCFYYHVFLLLSFFLSFLRRFQGRHGKLWDEISMTMK